MLLYKNLFAIIIIGFISLPALAKQACTEQELTKDKLIEIISHQRKIRSDLPAQHSSNKNYSVIRHGCHYLVIESGARLHQSVSFLINQKGIIVDANLMHAFRRAGKMKCNGKAYSTKELEVMVEELRLVRSGLPEKYPKYSVNSKRLGCLYIFKEQPIPRKAFEFHSFTFDSFGEFLWFSVN